MKIAVFGYYNCRNAGDDRLRDCLLRLLSEMGTVVFLPHFFPPSVEFLRQFDWILIGGGGLVYEHVGIWKDMRRWIRGSGARIGVLGLGVNHINTPLQAEVQDLIASSEFFFVRDRRSSSLLGDHRKVQVGPDLSWLYPIEIERSNADGVAFNLCPCHWQEFDAMAWHAEISDRPIRAFPLNFRPGQDADLLQTLLECQVPSEFSLEPLRQANYLVGARYHAITFAMQLKIPFVAIAYDYKVRRLCQEAGLERYCLATNEHEKLPSVLQDLELNREQIIDTLNDFFSAQVAAATRMKKAVLNIMASHPRKTERRSRWLLRKFR